MQRCHWAMHATPLEQEYHDTEWGVPVYDDRTLFEMLILEGAQAGLSWKTILMRREGYRQAFDGFDVQKVATYDEAKCALLCQDSRIIRHAGKIKAAVGNAQAFLKIQQEFGSFSTYLWQFVDGTPLRPKRKSHAEIPAETTKSQALSKDLRKRGFRFVGPTICYAFMQAVGMVDDHVEGCFRFQPLS